MYSQLHWIIQDKCVPFHLTDTVVSHCATKIKVRS